MMVLRKGVLKEEAQEAAEAPSPPPVFHYTTTDNSHLIVTRVKRGGAVGFLLMWRKPNGERDYWETIYLSPTKPLEALTRGFLSLYTTSKKMEAWEPFKKWWNEMQDAGRLK